MTDVSAWEQLDFDDPRRLVVFDPEEHHPPLLLRSSRALRGGKGVED